MAAAPVSLHNNYLGSTYMYVLTTKLRVQDDVQPISFCKEIERCDNGNLKNVKFNLL